MRMSCQQMSELLNVQNNFSQSKSSNDIAKNSLKIFSKCPLIKISDSANVLVGKCLNFDLPIKIGKCPVRARQKATGRKFEISDILEVRGSSIMLDDTSPLKRPSR